jgi:hypothetical protein
MPANFKPHLLSVELARHLLSWKVWAVSKLLRLLGHQKAVRKLQAGLDAFSVQNNPKNDTQLVFSSRALLALEAALDPSEAGDYLLVWRPMTQRLPGGAAGLGDSAAALQNSSAAAGSSGGSSSSSSGGHGSSGSRNSNKGTAAAGGSEAGGARCGGALAPVGGDLTWKRYLHTQMAGVYSVVFGAEVPQRQQQPAAVAGQGKAAAAAADEQYIVHDFRRIK